MKKLFTFIAIVVIANVLNAQVACINCENNNVDESKIASAIGSNNSSLGQTSFVGGENSSASGDYSFAFGASASANNISSFALGNNASAEGQYSYAFGFNTEASGKYSMAIGRNSMVQGMSSISIGKKNNAVTGSSYLFGQGLEAMASTSITIGIGPSGEGNYLQNNKCNSLMVGFQSLYPTLFVIGQASNNNDKTGRVGIGNITDPQAKLHIKADDNEDAGLLLEASGDNVSKIELGTAGNSILALNTGNMEFNTASDFYFNDANVGIGNANPRAKLHISDGDIFIEDINKGIIMKSPDGQCWRGTMTNSGNLQFANVDCSTFTSVKDNDVGNTPDIRIYPNPAKDFLKIEVEGNTKSLRVRVSDMNAKLVFSKKFHGQQLIVYTKSLPAGDYIIEVLESNGKKIYSSKLIVL